MSSFLRKHLISLKYRSLYDPLEVSWKFVNQYIGYIEAVERSEQITVTFEIKLKYAPEDIL